MEERIYVDFGENTTLFPENIPLAMSYVPYQQWNEIYSSKEGFNEGTMFPELNQKFMMGG
ncbi:hypothetical protein FACS1894132_13040 [Clostridia bacterium]|nr:hypothetical protein FACS1894132_13040 [Clostridia bacterium]